MQEQFYTILTKIGKSKITNATGLGEKVNLAKFKVGDSNGNYYNPTEEQTELRKVVYETNINSVYVDEDNPNWIVIEVVIPGNVGGFTIREAAAYDDVGNMIAIGKYPETYKPLSENGSTKDLIIKMILEVSNSSVVTIKVDPTVVFTSKKDLEVLENKIKKTTGDKNELTTKDKTNLVNAINEVLEKFNSIKLEAQKVTVKDYYDNFVYTNVEAVLMELADKIKKIIDDIGTNGTDIKTLSSKVTTNIENIIQNASDIRNLKSNVNSIKLEADNVSIRDSFNNFTSTNVEGALIEVMNNIKKIIDNSNTTGTDISTLNGKVKTNTDNIATNKTNITKNASDIKTANTNIAKNASDITGLNTKVSNHTSDITTLNTKVYANENNITKNTDAINALSKEVTGQTARLKTAVNDYVSKL